MTRRRMIAGVILLAAVAVAVLAAPTLWRKVAPLTDKMKPIVDQELASVGAIRAFDEMMRQYRSFPFVPDAKADLTGHVLERAVDGVFLYLAREEAAIRKDPVKRTTTLLRRVFAGR